MISVFAFSASLKCCKIIEFYNASVFTVDKLNNRCSQVAQVSFFVIKVHEVSKCILGVHLLMT